MPASNFAIRRAIDGDEREIARLIFRSVRELAIADYSPAQVAAWAPEPLDPEQLLRRLGDGRVSLVATDASGRICAYGDLELNGHIDLLYCHPDAAGMGAASLVYEAIEGAASDLGLTRLIVEASEPARRFFSRHGFALLGRQEVVRDGVALHNYRMEKRLPVMG